ncbi:MAG: hypothetical protein U9Q06_02845 [Nanoarchaeota archaeon]|nr:hypothetical protein [Nanoarchaeota archaeon]
MIPCSSERDYYELVSFLSSLPSSTGVPREEKIEGYLIYNPQTEEVTYVDCLQ